jgi:hypothetical protein
MEEVRAAVVAEGARRGLAGVVQEAILGLLATLVALIEDFRAGRLVAMAPGPAAACSGEPGVADRAGAEGRETGAGGSPRSEGMATRAVRGVWAWWRGTGAACRAGVFAEGDSADGPDAAGAAEGYRFAEAGEEHTQHPRRAPPAKRELRAGARDADAPGGSGAGSARSIFDAGPTTGARAIRPGRARRDHGWRTRTARLVLPPRLIGRRGGGSLAAIFENRVFGRGEKCAVFVTLSKQYGRPRTVAVVDGPARPGRVGLGARRAAPRAAGRGR